MVRLSGTDHKIMERAWCPGKHFFLVRYLLLFNIFYLLVAFQIQLLLQKVH
jgi:hypothetical protein